MIAYLYKGALDARFAGMTNYSSTLRLCRI